MENKHREWYGYTSFLFPNAVSHFQPNTWTDVRENKNDIVSSKYLLVPLKVPTLICTFFHSSEFLTGRSDLSTHIFPCACCGLRHSLFALVVHSAAKKLNQNILIQVCGRREVEQAIDKSWLDSSWCRQSGSSCWVNFSWFFFFLASVSSLIHHNP